MPENLSVRASWKPPPTKEVKENARALPGKRAPTAEEVAVVDKELIANLDIDSLLRLVGVCHRLGVISLLELGAGRVAGLLTEASRPSSERAGVPFDEYLRRDTEDALSNEERES